MAYVDHDYIDKIWDCLSPKQRKDWETFFILVLLNLEILTKWAGVDVIKGEIQRIIEEQEIWEDCPEVKFEYKRLLQYVKVIIRKDHTSQDMLNQ